MNTLITIMKTAAGLIVLALIIILPPIAIAVVGFLVYMATRTKNKRLYLMAAIAAAAAVASFTYSYLFVFNRFEPILPQVTYDRLETASLSGLTPGSGVIFKKPIEMKKRSDATDTTSSSATLTHITDMGYGIAFITVASVKSERAGGDTYLGDLNATLERGGEVYETAVAPIRQFAQAATGPGFDLELGTPRKFTNAYLRDNAWQFDVVARDKPGDEEDNAVLEGSLVMAVGTQASYYFMIFTTEHVWQSNEATWRQITDSLQIDR